MAVPPVVNPCAQRQSARAEHHQVEPVSPRLLTETCASPPPRADTGAEPAGGAKHNDGGQGREGQQQGSQAGPTDCGKSALQVHVLG